MDFIFQGVENIIGKEENAGYHSVHLFLQCSKTISLQTKKKNAISLAKELTKDKKI